MNEDAADLARPPAVELPGHPAHRRHRRRLRAGATFLPPGGAPRPLRSRAIRAEPLMVVPMSGVSAVYSSKCCHAPRIDPAPRCADSPRGREPCRVLPLLRLFCGDQAQGVLRNVGLYLRGIGSAANAMKLLADCAGMTSSALTAFLKPPTPSSYAILRLNTGPATSASTPSRPGWCAPISPAPCGKIRMCSNAVRALIRCAVSVNRKNWRASRSTCLRAPAVLPPGRISSSMAVPR